MANTIEEILKIKGIVIRNVTDVTECRWLVMPDDEEKHRKSKHFLGEGKNRREIKYEYYRNDKGMLIAKETRKNKYKGWLITNCINTNESVIFHKKTTSHGETIEEAYDNWKNGIFMKR